MGSDAVSDQPFLPFALPEIGEEEIAEVVDTLRSGWVTTGPKAKRFEADFVAFLEAGARSTGGARGTLTPALSRGREREEEGQTAGASVPASPSRAAGQGGNGEVAGASAPCSLAREAREGGGEGASKPSAPLHAVAVNSATAGLHLALEALGIGPGDEVITTTHTFTATAEVARYLGADVKLVDIDERTLNIDPAAVEAAITPATKAVIPVHYGGLAADMPALLGLARRHGLKVVEDAAHALPATSGGRLVGTLDSDATVFSFYANKTITTGEGGMLVTRNAALADRARVMRLHGMSRDAFDRFTAKVPSWYYEIVAPGFKYNLTDIAAALGLQQLKKAHAFQQRRAAIAARYDAAFADLPVRTPPRAITGELHAWHLYVLRLRNDSPMSRDALIEDLFDKGIGCSVHYIPLHHQPYWRDRYGLKDSDFPHSQRTYERALSLPIYTRMSDADVERVVAAVRMAMGR